MAAPAPSAQQDLEYARGQVINAKTTEAREEWRKTAEAAEAALADEQEAAFKPKETVGTGEAAARLGAEALVPFLHRFVKPTAEAVSAGAVREEGKSGIGERASRAMTMGYQPAGSLDHSAEDKKLDASMGGAYESTQKEELARLELARQQHPVMDVGADILGMMYGPAGWFGKAVGKGTKAVVGAEKLAARVATRGAAGAATTGTSAALKTGGAGGTLGESLKAGAGAVPAGAVGGAVLGRGGFKGVPYALAGGAAADLADSAVRGESPGRTVNVMGYEVPSMLVSALTNAVVPTAKGVRENVIRNPNTERGVNIAAVERGGGKLTVTKGAVADPEAKLKPGQRSIDQYKREGDRAIGEAAADAATENEAHLSKRLKDANASFGTIEEELLKRTPGATVSAEKPIADLDKWIASKTFADGTPIPTEDLPKLEKFRNSLMEVIDHPAGAIIDPETNQPFTPAMTTSRPKNITVRDLVKLRRTMDVEGNSGSLAGRDDVPYRSQAGLLREMIGEANPELAEHFKRHHEELSKLEQAHGALALREEAGLNPTQSMHERMQHRTFSYGMNDAKAAPRERSIEKAMTENPALRPGIETTRAVRGREELKILKKPLQASWTVGERGGGRIREMTQLTDPMLARIDPAIAGAEKSQLAPSLLFESIHRARKKKPEKGEATE